MAKRVYAHNQASGQRVTCGPAQLDKLLTQARARSPWLREGSSVPQQQVVRDFGSSRAKALKDIKAGLPIHRRTGMPRYRRKRETDPSLNYTRNGFRIKGGRLYLAGGIVLTVVWSRDLPATPSSVRVYRDHIGHWYCSFVVPARPEPLPATGRVIGIDWGVKVTATTTSDSYDLPCAGHGKQAREKLAGYDRMTARRKPEKGRSGSKGYRTAKRLRAKLYRKVARQGRAPGQPRAHHDGLRAVRSESQARTAAGDACLHLLRVRGLVSSGQELRTRDADQGWSVPCWC